MALIKRLLVLTAAITALAFRCAAEKQFPPLRPDQVISGRAKATPGIQGALLCRSLASVAFAATQLRDGAAPDLATLGCTLLSDGTAVTIEWENRAWIVRGRTLLGNAVSGVTDPQMIEIDKPAPLGEVTRP